MEEFNIQGKQTPFYKYCPGTFGYTLVHILLSFTITYSHKMNKKPPRQKAKAT
jgi:hypothetical protein